MQTKQVDHLMIENRNGVLYVTLHRPERLNAFSPEMITGLIEVIAQAKKQEDIRVVVIKGSGRAFCAGGDVKRMGERTSLETYEHLGNFNELIFAMKELEKPIVAAVHGYAAGAGFNLALACDMILASADSQFIMSFSKVGLISDGGGLYFLSKLIGSYRAKEVFFKAEPITAEEGYTLGFVNHIYPEEEFEEKVDTFVTDLASGPAVAFGFIKRLVDQSLHSNLADILEQERITQATLITTEDHVEGIQAFKEKRKPIFKGK